MELKLPETWIGHWKTTDLFEHVFNIQGEIFREQPGRKTLKFYEANQAYFLKLHFGVGWIEIFKNLFQLRSPVLGAQNEVHAIQHLEKYHFTPQLIGYGWRGKNPATQESFVICKALENTISLEDFCRDWKTQAPPLSLKWALIKKIAYIAKTMHDSGVNHRDFYICHFLLDQTDSHLYVIDWHRAQVRKKVPLRWRIKDIAGLYFSAMDAGLTQKDLWRFMRLYNKNHDPVFWQHVIKRATKLYRKTFKRDPDYVPR
ncbi:MAG TPA: lipopolysaccharide core heptose(I) kinase RfaP [Gammaproteobacteria bacterium]|nr:lipopolysaccharide core heptose(I) kinase RfaP [Gammaproteobacteria bacterium]